MNKNKILSILTIALIAFNIYMVIKKYGEHYVIFGNSRFISYDGGRSWENF